MFGPCAICQNANRLRFRPQDVRHRLKIAGFLPSLWLLSVSADAATLQIDVADRDGRPVPDVAVTAVLPGARVTPPGTRTTAIMDQVDQQLVPEVLVVHTGTPVVFPNSDSVAHQVYSFSPAKRFALGLYR